MLNQSSSWLETEGICQKRGNGRAFNERPASRAMGIREANKSGELQLLAALGLRGQGQQLLALVGAVAEGGAAPQELRP